MTSTAMLVRAGSCLPGGQTRDTGSERTSERYDPANPFPAFGLFGKIAPPIVSNGVVTVPGGAFVPLTGGETVDQIAGALCRAVPQIAGVTDSLYGETPEHERITQICQIHRAGFFGVHVPAGQAPFRDGPVFVRVGAAAPGKPLGGAEAAADGANTVKLPGARFCGGVDAAGNVEIYFRKLDGIN